MFTFAMSRLYTTSNSPFDIFLGWTISYLGDIPILYGRLKFGSDDVKAQEDVTSLLHTVSGVDRPAEL